MKPQHPWILLAAGIVTLLLVHMARAEAAPEETVVLTSTSCPATGTVEEHLRRLVSLPLPEGCPSPYSGRLYNREMRDAVRAEIKELETLVLETEKLRDEARRSLAECRLTAAQGLDSCADALSPPPKAPEGTPAWVWSGLAGVAALAPLLACTAIDCGPDHVPWLASAGGVVLVVGISWAVE